MKSITTSKISVLAALLTTTLGMACASSALATNAPTQMKAKIISLKQALAIAKAQTGAEPVEAEREVISGTPEYEIELLAPQGKEYKLRIDAFTGEIIGKHESFERDKDDLQEQADWLAGIASGKYLSLENALVEAKLKSKGEVYEIELDNDFGMHYKAKFLKADGSKVKVKIPAEK